MSVIRPPTASRLVAIAGASALTMAAALSGGAREASASVRAAHKDAPGIDWFAGSVDAAFAAAKRSHRPVFLYWGAVWCPPCQQIQSTVFSRRDFIEKSRLFVPVHLDGDTAGAQKLGETFKVTGYPTVLILRPDRSEVLRIAGSMDLGQYAGVLDLALGDVAPIAETLAAVSGGQSMSDANCKRLAYHGWVLEDRSPAEKRDLASQLASAVRHCAPALRLERARLVADAAYLAADSEAEPIKAGAMPSAGLAARLGELNEMLADAELARGSVDVLLAIGSPAYEAAARLPPPLAQELIARQGTAMDAAARDSNLAEADQIKAIAAKLVALKAISPQGRVPAAVAAAARSRVEQAVAQKHAQYVRSGVINSVQAVLDALDENERARDIVKNEMANAKAPYYYMSELGTLEEKLGNKAEALRWFERAYREAQGPATRFQWGAQYVLALLRLAPDDSARIGAVASSVLGELDGPEALYRRSRIRLATLDAKLREWNASGKRTDTLVALRSRLQPLCARIPKADAARSSCEAFLRT